MLTTVCHGALVLATLYLCWRVGRYLLLPALFLATLLLANHLIGL